MKYLFDWLTSVLQAAQPSAFAFVETTLPYSTPLPIALISAASATTFFGLKGTGAFFFVYSLEAIGLVATTRLVESVVDWVRSRNGKSLVVIIVLGLVVFAYVRILVTLNVTMKAATNPAYSEALTLICYLPMIAGTLNGMGLLKLNARAEQEHRATLEEQHRQEDREDRLRLEREKLQARKELEVKKLETQVEIEKARAQQGIVAPQPVAPQTFPVEKAGDYRQAVFDILDQNNGNVGLTDITRLINEVHQTHFIHADVKGTWFKYVQAWHKQRKP